MVQLDVLTGKKAGSRTAVRRFPFRVGRAADNDLQLDDDGVWNQHLALGFQRNESFTLEVAPDALATVNNESVQTTPLRNGDVISFGSVKIQFWLAAAKQHGLRLRELFVWTLVILVTLGQFTLIYWLIQ